MKFPSPSAGFDDPLGLLRDCHQRMESFCETLERLQVHVRAHGVDDEARAAIARILAYFNHAALHHHADEEVDLLPLLRLRAVTHEAQMAVTGWAARIDTDHRALAASWAKLRDELTALTDGHRTGPSESAAFVAMTRAHYRFEDESVFPLASTLLTADDRVALGQSMARRRRAGLAENV